MQESMKYTQIFFKNTMLNTTIKKVNIFKKKKTLWLILTFDVSRETLRIITIQAIQLHIELFSGK